MTAIAEVPRQAPSGDSADLARRRHHARHEAYTGALLTEKDYARRAIESDEALLRSLTGDDPEQRIARIELEERLANRVRRLSDIEAELERAVAQRDSLDREFDQARSRPDPEVEARHRALVGIEADKVAAAEAHVAEFDRVLEQLAARTERATSELERSELDRQRTNVLAARAAAERKLAAARAELRRVEASR
ncbi:MAG: hypothetical protein AB7L13_24985 [Acidimicrobiia bacterium]